jgi:hypothetical protein
MDQSLSLCRQHLLFTGTELRVIQLTELMFQEIPLSLALRGEIGSFLQRPSVSLPLLVLTTVLNSPIPKLPKRIERIELDMG